LPKPKLGVFAFMPHVTGTSLSTPFSNELIHALFDETTNFSLLRYWREVSGGELDFAPSVHPEIIMLEGQTYIDKLLTGRGAGFAGNVVQIMFDLDMDLRPYDAYAFFVLGYKEVDGGAYAFLLADRMRPYCVLGDSSSHTFMAHEMGHVLGLGHPFDTRSVADPKLGEYGDPTCIMSAEGFGGRGPYFSQPKGQRLFAHPLANFWNRLGPGVSPASVWRYSPTFPAPLASTLELPRNAPPTAVRLVRAGTAGTQLVTMPTGGANTWHTVEYRPSTGWDRAMHDDLAGVVIHQMRGSIGAAADGQGWPKIEPVCIAGNIRLPSTGDLDWSNGDIAVRIVEVTPGWVDLMVGSRAMTDSFARIGDTTLETHHVSDTDAERVSVPRCGPNCRTQTYIARHTTNSVILTTEVQAAGFGQPAVRWEINGVTTNVWATATVGDTDTLTLPVIVEVPTALGKTSQEYRFIDISYTAIGNKLTLNFPDGDGTYGVTIVAECTEDPAGTGATTRSEPSQQTIQTAGIQLPPEAIQDQTTCATASIAGGIQHGLGDGIDWGGIAEEMEEWAHSHSGSFTVLVREAVRLERESPAIGGLLLAQIATYMQTTPTDLKHIADEAFAGGKPG
jgi:hypothetical protein